MTRYLDEAGVTYALDSGTLLGVVRDNALMNYDSDIDVLILV